MTDAVRELEDESAVVQALVKLVCLGLPVLLPVVGAGLWFHNLWPALYYVVALGALLWIALILAKAAELRARKRARRCL